MTHHRCARAAFVLTLSLLAAATARAGDRLFASFPLVTGTSTADQRAGWIDLTSLQWGAGAAVSFANGGGGSVGRASASEIVWTQALDSTYPQLMTQLLANKGGKAQFDVVQGNQASSLPYLSLKTDQSLLGSTSFSNDSLSASAGFGSITLSWDPKGLGGNQSAVSTTWDVARGTVKAAASSRPTVSLASIAPAAVAGLGTNMYLRLGTGNAAIAGTSAADGYENWIKIDSAQFGAGRSVSSGASGGSQVSKPSFSDLTWSQQADATLPVMLGLLAKGTMLTEATLEYVRYGAHGPVTFMQMVMHDVAFTNLSLSTGAGSEGLQTSESIAFGSFSQTVWGFDADGRRGAPSSFAYDIVKNASMGVKSPISVTGFGAGNLDGSGAAAQVVLPPPEVALVPEPGQWALMLAGLSLLAGIARRRSAGTAARL